MRISKLTNALLITTNLLLSSIVFADEIKFHEWTHETTKKFSKAMTKNEAGSEFGIICADKCFYYINSGTVCTSNNQYLVMMSTEYFATTLKMNCVLRENNYFQILDNFDVVKKTIAKGNNISFVTSLDNGIISASFFGLKGAYSASNKTISDAIKNKYPTPKMQDN